MDENNDNVNDINGNHYASLGISPFEYSFANRLDCYQHTAIKYITRYANKGGLGDIDKAIKTLELYKRALGSNEEKKVIESYELAALDALIKGLKRDIDRGDLEVNFVFSIGRGGAWAAAQVAYALDVHCAIVDTLDLFDDAGVSMGSAALFVDDICDTGLTMYKVKDEYPDAITAALFNRAPEHVKVKKAIQPDYYGQMIWHGEYVEMPLSQYADLNKRNNNVS